MRTNVNSILLACMFAGPLGICAQITPLFQTTFYFEDNLGNRDSVAVGYDPEAQWGTIEPQYGEIEITSPFDSVFEVRAVHYSDEWLARTVKVLIERGSPGFDCVNHMNAIFLVNALHPPVTITYDSMLFPYDACGNVFFTRNWDVHFVEDWWSYCHHCLTSSSSYVEAFEPPQAPFDGLCHNFHYTEKEVAGQGLKMLPQLLIFTFGIGPCNDSTFVSTGEVATTEMPFPWPNPAVDHFFLKPPDGVRIGAEVLDLMGRKMACAITTHEGGFRFDVGALPKGFYLVSMWREDGLGRAVRKLVIR